MLGGTTLTESGTRKIRYGTDLRGAGMHGTRGKIGYVRKGVRRYTGRSRMLQASGAFKKSFRPLAITSKGLMYGTRFKNAEGIMSNPARPVVFVTEKDRHSYFYLFRRFVTENIRF